MARRRLTRGRSTVAPGLRPYSRSLLLTLETPCAPIVHRQDYGSKRAALLGQRVVDPRRHLRKDFTVDEAALFF